MDNITNFNTTNGFELNKVITFVSVVSRGLISPFKIKKIIGAISLFSYYANSIASH